MELEQIVRNAEQLMKQASDDAERARLAYVSGSYDAYIQSVFKQASERVNQAYDELDGPRDSGTV